MKKGEPLKPMLQKIDEDKKHKEDYLVNLKSLNCLEWEGEVYPALKFNGSTGKVNAPMTDHALGQLCNKLEIGTGYINCQKIKRQNSIL